MKSDGSVQPKRWLLATAILALGLLLLYTFFLQSADEDSWTRLDAANFEGDLEWQEEAARLEALGYLGGSEPAPDRTGVLLNQSAPARQGLNLYTSASDFNVRLMDMDGKLLHIWKLDLQQLDVYRGILNGEGGEAFGKLLESKALGNPAVHAYLYPDGAVLMVYRKFGLVKIDKDSNVLWHTKDTFHHDIDILPDGRIYTFAVDIQPRRLSRFFWLNDTRPTRMDYIVSLDAHGKELKRFSVLKAFEGSKYRHVLSDMPESGDITHSNEIVYLDGSKVHLSPNYKEGNLLISCREIDAIAIVDPELEEVVWAIRGPWKRQHSPELLDNGNILLFDNRGMGERSRVIEIEPETKTIVWSYGEQPGQEFYSWECGASQRLDNGNTMITESTKGHAMEVTPDHEVVWEFVNPFRRGNQTATLFRVLRIDPSYTLGWLETEED